MATAAAKKLVKDYNELQTRINGMRKEFTQACKEVFMEGIGPLFKKFPILERIQWAQYTPYFNDGDPCTFSANTSEAAIYFKPTQATNEERDYEEDYDGDFSLYDYYDGYGKDRELKKNLTERQTQELTAGEAVRKFLAKFSEEQYQMMFDDHVRVIITPNGIEVEGYDHD